MTVTDRELRPQWPKKRKRKTARELETERHTLQTFLIRIIESDGADRNRAIKEARSWLKKQHGWGYDVLRVFAMKNWNPDDD